jgi:hypothetical protein
MSSQTLSLSPLDTWTEREQGAHLRVIREGLNIISVFDELRYDRADADIVSPAMRMHVVKRLQALGFKQKSGSVIIHKESDTCCLIPKAHAIGASPFHITDYTPKRAHDFYVLTPTQTACQLINHYSLELALEHLKNLIQVQPINILRLSDYLESSGVQQEYLDIIGHLKYLQREALASPALKKLRPLSLFKH